MNIQGFLKEQYPENLEQRYDSLKANLENEQFVPEAEEVWRMYEENFHENNGICNFICSLLGADIYDESGRLNEFHRILDEYNHRMSDFCCAYVAGMKSKT